MFVSETATQTVDGDQKYNKALVIGGSIAGLLAARVLSDYFAEVLIVERDDFPEKPTNRPGTPQAYHPHRLLTRGKRILEKFFPDYTADLLAHGAYPRENKAVRLINPYGSLDVVDENDTGCSRVLFEWVIRQRVHALANVRFLTKQEVIGLQTTPDQIRVTGITVRERGSLQAQTTLTADLVIDASGRASKLIKWLQTLGYAVPAAERLKVSLGYSTRYYKIPAHLVDRWSVVMVEAHPEKGIGTGGFSPVENDIAEVLFYWAGGEYYPTTDPAAYEQEATKLLSPALTEVLQQCTPLTDPRGYRVEECIRQHFEQMSQWPAGLLVLGDAFCYFDPIYGQGMTIAAIEAEILAACLGAQQHDPQPGFELAVLAQMQAAIEPAWWLSAVADLRWPGVEYSGPYSLEGMRFTQKYFDRCLKQSYTQQDMALFGQYMMMTTLEISPRAIINQAMIETVLAADPSAEAQPLLADFPTDQSLEVILAELIPTFAHAFAPQGELAAVYP